MNVIQLPFGSPAFERLPLLVKREAREWQDLLNAIARSPCKAKAIRLAADEKRGRRGFSFPNIKRRYREALRVGWEACVNYARVQSGGGLSVEFQDWWIGLREKYQRSQTGMEAFKAFRKQYLRWLAGDASARVPGLGETCPSPDPSSGMPPGCGYRNLIRLKPTRAESAFAKQGIAAARAFLPCAHQDVSGVRPLEFILFDDVELDFLVVIPGVLQPVKLRLLVAMDLCSRVILGYGVRPAIPRADGVEDGLKLRDMKCIVARVLRTWGYPLDYAMTLICENATAKITQGDELALAEISGGLIKVSRTSMVVGSVFAFRDKASGNSWGKAWLESTFNPLHNKLSNVEGQKGRRYDLAPAELEGRKKELAALVRTGQRLPLALRYQFQWPFPTLEAAMQEVGARIAELNARTEHELQGFERVLIWRLNERDSWKEEAELAQYPELVGKVQTDTRLEQPLERLAKKMAGVRRQGLDDCSLQQLMVEHVPVWFKDWQFTFRYEGSDYLYLPADSLLPRLKDETQYLAWFDPSDMQTVYLTRPAPHGGWIGKVELFQRSRKGDIEAAKEALRQKQHVFNEVVSRVQGRQLDKFYRQGAALDHNTEIARNAAALDVEVDAARPTGGELVPATTAPESVREMTRDQGARRSRARTDAAIRRQFKDASGELLEEAPAAAPAAAAPAGEKFDAQELL